MTMIPEAGQKGCL